MYTAHRRRVTIRIIPVRPGPFILLCLTLLATGAGAQESLAPKLSIEGFGTVGAAYSTEDDADFVTNGTRPRGPGYSGSLSGSIDSRLAAQATLLIGSKLKMILQLMAEQTADGDYIPHAEWANVSYSFTPDLSVRGGRIVMPAFLVSDSRKVSYATPWARPPVELYSMVPIFSLDGADATYRTHLGGWTGTVNAAFGHAHSEFPGGTFETDNLWNVNATVHRGELTARSAVTGGRLRLDASAALFEGLRAFGPVGESLASRFDPDDRSFRFATAGMEYDAGSWFAIGELAWVDFDSALGEKLAGYVTGGLRLGAITPYATYSRAALLTDSSVAGLPLTGLPPQVAHRAGQLNATLNTFLRRAPVQQNWSGGVRWDFRPGLALKTQVDLIDVAETSQGTFTNHQPGFDGGRTQLVSVGVVFVY